MITLLKKMVWCLFFFCINASDTNAVPKELSVNATFSGVLIEHLSSCTIHPGDENIVLPFSMVNINDLQTNPETERYQFSIRLENCETDPSKPGSVSVYLEGESNATGMLVFDVGSEAKGAVIGIENLNGIFQAVNSPSPSMVIPLNTTETEAIIVLQAYLKVEDPAALASGNFQATLKYILEYQ